MFKQNPSILKFFSEQKWMHHSPPQMLNSYLIKGDRPSLSLCLFYEPQSWYIANHGGSAKETVSLKIGKNIEMLVLFVWGHKIGL